MRKVPPGGGFQWAGLYAPSGNVLIGSQTTNDIRVYDPATAAYLYTLCSFPGPADMEIGPNGNLYVCSYTGRILIVDLAFRPQEATSVQRSSWGRIKALWR